jgi:ssDNA-binding Zn-finger/Zn-ribbon topoisomerase 1
MSQGEISLEVTLADLVLGPGAFSTLRFKSANQEALVVMNEADSKPAVRCEACGHFMIITNAEYTDTQCVVCNTAMAAGITSCPECGWSYQESPS